MPAKPLPPCRNNNKSSNHLQSLNYLKNFDLVFENLGVLNLDMYLQNYIWQHQVHWTKLFHCDPVKMLSPLCDHLRTMMDMVGLGILGYISLMEHPLGKLSIFWVLKGTHSIQLAQVEDSVMTFQYMSRIGIYLTFKASCQENCNNIPCFIIRVLMPPSVASYWFIFNEHIQSLWQCTFFTNNECTVQFSAC